GRISWVDLTVPDAPGIRDFYAAVVGWRAEDVDMGGYADFNMVPPGADEAAAGICHARGQNGNIPPVWLVYITVDDLAASLAEATKRGASVLDGPRDVEGGGFAVIRDPAGAVCALYQEPPAG
ncbi:MAG: VOC family protein, partial [Dehalococcoidia bacterium]